MYYGRRTGYEVCAGGNASSQKRADARTVAPAMSNWIAAPMDRKPFEPRNRLLAALPARDLLSLQPHLAAVPLAGGNVLFEGDERLDRVYFVDTGVVSLVSAFENNVTAGVAAVGREGVVGATALLLGGDTALGRSRVLVPGSALALEVPRFRNALGKSLKLRAACEAATRALLVQMLQSVPCNGMHTVEQRCARWLLVCADRTESDTFDLSQECLAEMLGVPKSRLPSVARKLQQAGLICCRRSATTVINRRELEAVACECYRIVRNRYERLLTQAFG